MSELTRVNPVTFVIDREIESLRSVDTAKLKKELESAVRATAAIILRMAAIVRLLEERGEDISTFRFGIIPHLRRIAYGQVLPEVIVHFQGQPMLMDRVAGLPLADQNRILSGEPIRIVQVDGGNMEHRTVPAENLTRDEILQVFGKSGIRNDAEQLAVVRARKERAPKRTQSNIIVDFKRGGILVNGLWISKADLIMYVQRLRKNKKPLQDAIQ